MNALARRQRADNPHTAGVINTALESAMSDETERQNEAPTADIGHNSGERIEPASRDKANGDSLSSLIIAMSAGTSELLKQFRTRADELEQFLLQDAADIKSRVDSHIKLGGMISDEVRRMNGVVEVMRKRHEEIVKRGGA